MLEKKSEGKKKKKCRKKKRKGSVGIGRTVLFDEDVIVFTVYKQQ